MRKKLLFTVMMVCLFGISTAIAQETFTVSEPFSDPAVVSSVFFMNSNSSSGDEVFIGGEISGSAATSKTYKSVSNSSSSNDFNFNLNELEPNFAKTNFSGGSYEDIIYCNDDEVKIFLGTASGNFTNVFNEVIDLNNPRVTAFDYDDDGDIDGYYSGRNGPFEHKIIRNDGGGIFTLIDPDDSLPASDSGSVTAGLINGSWYIVITGDMESGTQRGIYKLNSGGTTFSFIQSLIPFADSSVNFADANGDDVNDITVTGASAGIRTTKVYELNGGSFSEKTATGLPGIQGGFIDYSDLDGDGNMDAVCVGQTGTGGTQIFEIRYGSGNFQYNGTVQTFTNSSGNPITLSQASLDIDDSGANAKIVVSGNLGPAGVVPRAYLLEQQASTDSDGDGIPDTDDVCPGFDDTVDTDSDGTPDGCDDDDDGDGVPDSADLCDDTPPGDTVDSDGCTTTDPDSDGDGVPDSEDICPGFDDTLDLDMDGTPNGCDDDMDGDDVDNNNDDFPMDPAEQQDTDGDGIGDNGDTDDDNDGTLDVDDPNPLVATTAPDEMVIDIESSSKSVNVLINDDFNPAAGIDLDVTDVGDAQGSLAINVSTGEIAYTPSQSEKENGALLVLEYTVSNTNVSPVVSSTNTLEVEVEKTLSIQDNDFSKSLKVYPNPAQDRVTISLPTNVELENITIYNLLGQKVMTSQDSILNVSELASGQYIIQVQSTKGVGVVQLLKR